MFIPVLQIIASIGGALLAVGEAHMSPSPLIPLHIAAKNCFRGTAIRTWFRAIAIRALSALPRGGRDKFMFSQEILKVRFKL